MLFKIIIITSIIIFIYYLTRPLPRYENTFGHSKKNIAQILQTERHDPFIVAEIYNFNLENKAAATEHYEIALQQAIYNSLEPQPERVLDRIIPFEFIQPAARMNTGNEYFIRTVRNDAQNVHDTNVRMAFEKKHELLMDNGCTYANLDILRQKCSPRALEVVNRIETNEAYIEGLNNTDRGVLCAVANRAAEYPEIYNALNKSLENCIEDGELVCVTGRVSNILDALTLLDPVYGKPVITTEMLRKDILQDTLNYLNTIPDERRENDAENVGTEIEEIIKKKYSSPLLDKLIEEAKAGI